MPLTAGEPAEPWDTWLRVITNEKYIKSDGTLHNSAFTGKAISPPDPAKPWALELSGALLSLIGDLRTYGQEFCGDKFAGFMFQKVENLRNEDRDTDVIFTPRTEAPADPAHSDLVAYRLEFENKAALKDWLQDFIQVARLDKLDGIDALRQAA
jgi:hypothetical protein